MKHGVSFVNYISKLCLELELFCLMPRFEKGAYPSGNNTLRAFILIFHNNLQWNVKLHKGEERGKFLRGFSEPMNSSKEALLNGKYGTFVEKRLEICQAIHIRVFTDAVIYSESHWSKCGVAYVSYSAHIVDTYSIGNTHTLMSRDINVPNGLPMPYEGSDIPQYIEGILRSHSENLC